MFGRSPPAVSPHLPFGPVVLTGCCNPTLRLTKSKPKLRLNGALSVGCLVAPPGALNMNKRSLLATLLATTMMAACGGGGGSGNGNTAGTSAQIDSGAGITPDSGTTQQVAMADTNPVGIGIYGLSYFDQSFAMADVVRQSQFKNMSWGDDVGADAQGLPTRDFQMIFSSKVIGAGTYKLKFKGQATISVAATPSGRIENKTYDTATNTTTADVVLPSDSTGNTWLTFTNTRRTSQSVTADGVSDLQMWRPGYPTDGSATFTREFITAMQKFHVIRVMDFVNANLNPSVNWDDRTKPDFKGYTGVKGQSWELVVALANATNRDVWINVPVQANDEYIRKLALLFKNGSDGQQPYSTPQSNPIHRPLNTNLKVYLEYGNEIWNTSPGFNGFGWAMALSDANRLDTSHPIAFDGAQTDRYVALRRWIAYRSAFISLAFRDVFGDSQMMTRVRPIFASQVGNGNQYLSEGLLWANTYHGDASRLWYGGGGAAYYDSTTPPNDTNPSTMSAYFAGLPSPNFARVTATDTIWTNGFGLKNIAYEGGPGPGGSPLGTASGTAELSYTYNNDPRMKDRMIEAHAIWQANGGDMLAYYVYSVAAPWSFTNGLNNNTTSDSTSLKFQAIDSIKVAPKATATLGTAIPGTVYLRNSTSNVRFVLSSDGSWKHNGTAYRLLPNRLNPSKNEFMLVPVRATLAGKYRLSITTYDATVNDQVEILANGKLIGTVQPTPGAAGQAYQSSEIEVDLPSGITVIMIRAKAGPEIWVKDLVVTQ